MWLYVDVNGIENKDNIALWSSLRKIQKLKGENELVQNSLQTVSMHYKCKTKGSYVEQAYLGIKTETFSAYTKFCLMRTVLSGTCSE